jgi:hypothetical protein
MKHSSCEILLRPKPEVRDPKHQVMTRRMLLEHGATLMIGQARPGLYLPLLCRHATTSRQQPRRYRFISQKLAMIKFRVQQRGRPVLPILRQRLLGQHRVGHCRNSQKLWDQS